MGDLSITALYTAEAWRWGGFAGAELFASDESRRVFDATNAALALFGRRDLPHALAQRHAMIDRLLADTKATRVLELAAGLSRRGAALTKDPRVEYTEIDLAPVIARKRALLERTAEGRAVLARPNYRLVAGDVSTSTLSLEPFAAPVVIAEGLFVYLDVAAQRRLAARIAALPKSVTFLFDLTPPSEQPPPGLGGKLLGAAMRRFTGGKGFAPDGRTRAEITADLRGAGFTEARAIAAADMARDWALPHAGVRTDTVIHEAVARPA
jgi:O-methyltransferase involved in polyketide biosynthesis